MSNEFGLTGTKRFATEIMNDIETTKIVNLGDNIRKLQKIFEAELSEQWVMHIPASNSWWFNNKDSFEGDVIKAFPSSSEDIKEAGNCYALDCPTACVFHTMRILEHGISALARDVGLTFEMQQWHTIIEAIESKIKELRKLPKGAEKEERLQFLSEAAKELMYFKDGWRNHVTHRQTFYDMHQAHSILLHVRSFMMCLSTQLKE